MRSPRASTFAARPDRRAVAAAAIVSLAAFFIVTRVRTRTVAEFFAVGQGDAALVQCGRAQLLIDGGPDRTVLAKLGRSMPLFDRTIELVVLTHPHADHYLGLIAVFERYRVGTLVVSGAVGDTAEYAAFDAAARDSGARIAAVRAGDRLALGTCARFDVLWPGARDVPSDDPNDASVVLRMVPAAYQSSAVLFMADAGQAVERELIAGGADLRASVLKVGHHGSRTATTRAWLDAVHPSIAVIAVGKNRYGHPAWATLERLRGARTAVFRTDEDGDVRIAFAPDGPRVRLRSRFGHWRSVPTEKNP